MPEDMARGLYRKYDVRRVRDNSEVANCFVLQPEKDAYSRAALAAYADACEADYPTLARDLRRWLLMLPHPAMEPSKIVQAVS